MDIQDRNFNSVSNGQNFKEDAQFKAKVKTENGKEFVIFKTKESMNPTEQTLKIIKIIAITIITLGLAFINKNIRKDIKNEWKSAIRGENKKFVKIEKEFIPEELVSSIKNHSEVDEESFNLSTVKILASQMEIMKKINKGEERIEIDEVLSDSMYRLYTNKGYILNINENLKENDEFIEIALTNRDLYLVKKKS